MSTFKVEVVKLEHVEKHPNADTLSIAKIFNFPVIFRTEDYAVGELVAYIPVDSVVPDTPEWEFLGKHKRIKAKKLRGVFSMGLLAKLPQDDPEEVFFEGDDVAERMGITKFFEPEPVTYGGKGKQDANILPEIAIFPRYTDVENYLRYADVLKPLAAEGTEFVITEKLHGANGRFLFLEGQMHVGSMRCLWKPESQNQWWKIAEMLNLPEKLADGYGGLAIYGEVYGNVQDLKYGMPEGIDFRVFDMLNVETRQFLDWDMVASISKELGLKTVPVLYRGFLPSAEALKAMTEGNSTLADNIREGIVIKPVRETVDFKFGRIILKYVGEQYLLRKGGTEGR